MAYLLDAWMKEQRGAASISTLISMMDLVMEDAIAGDFLLITTSERMARRKEVEEMCSVAVKKYLKNRANIDKKATEEWEQKRHPQSAP